ncbi:hypothetical protein [Streptomyces sp. NPDC005438]|uniref:hypothetical protein n=1 Tax=Streptomyces sp. NPDC005438 TaxID=3156880 RepID=UPI0033AB0FE8
MTVTALMWEAKAAEGRGERLLEWARAAEPVGDGSAAPGEPLRREHLTAPGGRVLVITWWDTDREAAPPELPEPPPALLARPVHRWRFTRVD